MSKWFDYLTTNLNYPVLAKTNNVQGKVFVSFVVEKDGSLTDPKVLHGIGSGCNEEAIRLVKNSPKWIPAAQNGKAVRVYYPIPIKFSLAAK
jgi:protein TonB